MKVYTQCDWYMSLKHCHYHLPDLFLIIFTFLTLLYVEFSQIQAIYCAHVVILCARSGHWCRETIGIVGAANNCNLVFFQGSITRIFDWTRILPWFPYVVKRDKDQSSVLLPLIWLCRLCVYMQCLVACPSSMIFIVFYYDVAT